MTQEIRKNLKHNLIVNIADGSFYGLGVGLSSFNTVLPLFVATMTDSAILIGLIPAIHNVGWQLPQLFTAQKLGRLERFKPFVSIMTIQERIPFLALAIIAYFSPHIGSTLTLLLTFFILIWQGLGAGFTANGWQNMVNRIMPPEMLATFFGLQSAGANLLASGGAVVAGFILEQMTTSNGFAICFFTTSICMVISYGFLQMAREPSKPVTAPDESKADFWRKVSEIMKKDVPFRWFVIARNAFQFGMMAQAFFIIYAIKAHGLSLEASGFMTGLLFVTQVAANPILGWISDKWSSSIVLKGGAVAIGIASLLAWWAPSADWFYLITILSGIASTAFWTIGIAMSLEFGSEEEKPTYVGLANTLIAPSTIFAPLIAGWIADLSSYTVTFFTAVLFSTLAVITLQLFVKDKRKMALDI